MVTLVVLYNSSEIVIHFYLKNFFHYKFNRLIWSIKQFPQNISVTIVQSKKDQIFAKNFFEDKNPNEKLNLVKLKISNIKILFKNGKLKQLF